MPCLRTLRSLVVATALIAGVLGSPAPAAAFEGYAAQVPNRATAVNTVGTTRPCITCHDNADGGSGCGITGGPPPCLNPFGLQFRASAYTWSASLANMDADGDGFRNGQELQDPSGSWVFGLPTPGNASCVTRPGFSNSHPGQIDADGDGYCCFGRDLNMNGTCSGFGSENGGQFDCDDSDNAIHSGATEVCTNAEDDDCDGQDTFDEPMCSPVVDRDGDGFCPMGVDLNGDGNCVSSAAEMTSASDCDDTRVTVNPDQDENCGDGRDNDCDGDVDTADSTCRNDVDADDDGFCPLGTDVNDDGDCMDAGENVGGDCDDSDPLANSGATEVCTDGSDNDCDGDADFMDDMCVGFEDEDGDGYCPAGQDMDGDGSCVDPGEEGGLVDCNDAEPTINPGAPERCLEAVDADCDGNMGIADTDCGGFRDSDGDGYCFRGRDMDGDGSCVDPGEADVASDCRDDLPAVNPDATELCTDGLDNDCDGSTDAYDPLCSMDYLDHDGDFWCEVGEDLNTDGDCSDPGEQGGPADAAPMDPTIYPGAPENCIDGKDNDQDGTIDRDDDECTSDVDADGDGWCPLGQDLNGDGDCNDDMENVPASDCDDMDFRRNPGVFEAESPGPGCLNRRDDDCDGFVDLDDSECTYLLDRDGDGFCGVGIDDNGDGDCIDLDEDRGGAVIDCDDDDPTSYPSAAEICDDDRDNDCDGRVDALDPACGGCAGDGTCNDGNPCTTDRCTDDGLGCENIPIEGCTMGDGGMDVDMGGDGCGCRTAGGSNDGWPILLVLGALIGWRRRRR